MGNAAIENITAAEENILDWIQLSRTVGIGSVSFHHLLKLFSTPSAALAILPELSKHKKIDIATRALAEAEYEAGMKAGAELLHYQDPRYPALLKNCDDAPPFLWVKGQIDSLANDKIISVVGTRQASAAGCHLTASLVQPLSQSGWLIVSGMALGIDTVAHKSSLAQGTVAVLGSGVGVPYPPQNEALYAQICENGAIISEMPPQTQPQARLFPRRNRIIAGMGCGLLVVEATVKSGSLITAEQARHYQRLLFSVPGSPMDKRSAGSNLLLKQGAHMVETAQDMLFLLEKKINSSQQELFSNDDKKPPMEEDNFYFTVEGLDKAEQIVRTKLTLVPIPIESLVAACGLSLEVVMCVLVRLELAGELLRHPGQEVSLNLTGDYDW